MANLPESATYDAGVYQIETTDPVQGGASGKSNQSLKNLANRTAYLKAQVDALNSAVAAFAGLNSPAFTGNPTAPTPTSGDNDTSLATTAFVQNAAGGVASVNVAGGSNVTLTAAQYGCRVIVLTGAITANINVIFPTQNDEWTVFNNTSGAFSITCKTAAGTGVVVTQGFRRGIYCDATNINFTHTDYKDVALTGAPTAPTPTAGDNSTKIATTAFVQTEGSGGRAWAVKTANYNIVTKDRLIVNPPGAGVVLTLPASPATGAEVMIKGNFATYNVTVARNGSTIVGLAENLVLDKDNISAHLVYDGSTWRV